MLLHSRNAAGVCAMPRALLLLLLPLLFALSPDPFVLTSALPSTLPPNHYWPHELLQAASESGSGNSRYVFVLQDNATLPAAVRQRLDSLSVSYVNRTGVLNAFHGAMSTDSLQTLQADSELMGLVQWVERDVMVKAGPVAPRPSSLSRRSASSADASQPSPANNSSALLTDEQSPPSWGIDRIDQQSLPLDNQYHYPSNLGPPANVYIIDTGINVNHVDLDNGGHGTFVAGIIGGKSFGVAKNANLIAVKALDENGEGPLTAIVQGIEWVVSQHTDGERSVCNLSLGSTYSMTLNQVVNRAMDSGIVFVAAAGNDGADACTYSPASARRAITVGATDQNDVFAYFSNHGACVDLLAPGVGITSSWNESNTATNTLDGTSFAAPHVAGVAALILSSSNGSSFPTPDQVKSSIVNNVSKNQVSSLGLISLTPNAMLFSLDALGIAAPVTQRSAAAAATFSPLFMVMLTTLWLLL
ncbi:hypothetical protein RI367_004479 [Sorochytrium milnesiophthora]